jgi:hypothetical protein
MRRECKKRLQREAAMQLRSGLSGTPISPHRLFNLSVAGAAPVPVRKKKITTPILQPSTFLFDSFKAEEWVLVHADDEGVQHGTGVGDRRW